MQPLRFFAILAILCSSLSSYAASKELHIYNWTDYIAPDTIANFEKETGIKVVYDVYDSNETLEAKLMAGNTGFDIVIPTTNFLGRQIRADIFAKLDLSKLPNYKNLDTDLLKYLAIVDPNNAHGVPYLWGTNGIGINVKKVKAALGENVALDSWDLFFKPENLSKLKSCGVAILDSPSEIVPITLHYMGKNPNSREPEDFSKAALEQLMKIRPYITYFHSSQYINDLANGNICFAVGFSGDILQAAARAKEANKGVEVQYILPKEGTLVWFDVMAIPKDSKNIDNALAFINFVMKPEVMAAISNTVQYANANKPATAVVNPEIVNNPSVYPTEEVKKKLFMQEIVPPKIDRVLTRAWTQFKTGR